MSKENLKLKSLSVFPVSLWVFTGSKSVFAAALFLFTLGYITNPHQFPLVNEINLEKIPQRGAVQWQNSGTISLKHPVTNHCPCQQEWK